MSRKQRRNAWIRFQVQQNRYTGPALEPTAETPRLKIGFIFKDRKMLRRILACVIALTSVVPPGYSFEILTESYESFYSNQKFLSAYQADLESGKIEQSIKFNRERCEKVEQREEKEKCLCVAKAMAEIDTKVIYYESLRNYARYTKMVEAKINADDEEYERLKNLKLEPHPEFQRHMEKCQ